MTTGPRDTGMTILIVGTVRPHPRQPGDAHGSGNEATERQLAAIRAAAPLATVDVVASQADVVTRVEEAEIVFGRILAAALARARRLEWVQSPAAGPNALLYPEMLASDVLVTGCKGNGAISLAEHAVMLMLMLNRDTMRWMRAQQAHRWEHVYHGELTGLTCGIIGLGHSGQDLAAKAKAFHVRVIGVRRSDQPVPSVDLVYPRARLHAFLGEADLVVVAAPLTPETRGLLGEAEFRAMKPTAYYICFSRGGIADDAVLLRALNKRWIAGAGLDAHSQEPLPPDSPFWTVPDTIVTPHNGAVTALTRQRRRRYLRGEPAPVRRRATAH